MVLLRHKVLKLLGGVYVRTGVDGGRHIKAEECRMMQRLEIVRNHGLHSHGWVGRRRRAGSVSPGGASASP